MNLWITCHQGKYWATAGASWECGSFKRAVRAVLVILRQEKAVTRLILPSLRELKRWSRVEDIEVEAYQRPLLDFLERREIELTLPPGVSLAHPWETLTVAVKKPRVVADDRLAVYTDGSCLGNPGFGGWGFTSKLGERSGSEPSVTNNRMEMMAVYQALKFFRKQHPERPLRIISDSRYVLSGCTDWRHKWARKGFQGIVNSELWKQLARECSLADVEFSWQKGHSGNVGNERADKLAGDAAHALKHQTSVSKSKG